MAFVGFCTSLGRILLFIATFLFWCLGILLIVVGAIILIGYREYDKIVGSSFITAPIILIAAGGVLFLVSFLGCCGAAKKNVCMLYTFGIILFVAMVATLVGAIFLVVRRDLVNELVQQNLQKSISNYNSESKSTWDVMQSEYHCCGIDSFRDWTGVGEFVGTRANDVPATCCSFTGASCDGRLSVAQRAACGDQLDAGGTIIKILTTTTNVQTCPIFVEGCYKKFTRYTTLSTFTLMIIAFVISGLLLVGVALSCCIATFMRKRYEYA